MRINVKIFQSYVSLILSSPGKRWGRRWKSKTQTRPTRTAPCWLDLAGKWEMKTWPPVWSDWFTRYLLLRSKLLVMVSAVPPGSLKNSALFARCLLAWPRHVGGMRGLRWAETGWAPLPHRTTVPVQQQNCSHDKMIVSSCHVLSCHIIMSSCHVPLRKSSSSDFNNLLSPGQLPAVNYWWCSVCPKLYGGRTPPPHWDPHCSGPPPGLGGNTRTHPDQDYTINTIVLVLTLMGRH